MMRLTQGLPTAEGFAMPAEWDTHAATWTSWPFDDEMWHGHLDAVRNEFAALVRVIASFETVHVNLRDEEAEADARARLAGVPVVFHRVPLNDVWFRDNGPLFVTRPQKEGRDVSFVHWDFNGWGEKFDAELDTKAPEMVADFLKITHWKAPFVMEGGSLEPNGLGVCLTTRQCLLSPKRNPSLSEKDIEKLLKDWMGFEQIIWLDEGLEGDHTDGHIDTITRFAAPWHVVTSVCADPQDKNHHTMKANLEVLKKWTGKNGETLTVTELPLPAHPLHLEDGLRLPPTYANFYIGNGFVVVPQYNDPHDSLALQVLKAAFPRHEVIGSPSRHIIMGGGSFHCVTQQQPSGAIWRT